MSSVKVSVVVGLVAYLSGFWANSAVAQNVVEILSPVANTEVVSGSTVVVSVKTKEPVDGVSVMGEGFLDIGEAAGPASSFSVSIRIPDNVVGARKIVAMAPVSTGVLYSKEVSLIVVPSPLGGSRLDLGGISRLLFKYPGDEVRLPLLLTSPDGTSKKVLPSAPVVWISENEGVAKHLNDGAIVATGSGQTDIRFTYMGLEGKASVQVSSIVRGDFNGDGYIDLLDIEHLKVYVGSRVKVPTDARDLNGDGKIDDLDLSVLRTLCTRPDCVTD